MGKGKEFKKQPKARIADRGKEPRSAIAVRGGREARAVPINPNAASPVWAFRIVDFGGPWAWPRITPGELREVLARLGSFETMTWQEIQGADSHVVGFGSLCREAQGRLVQIGQDDAAESFSLRINGPGRVWGIRDREVLRILWWDPRHEVCPSPKKHT